MSQATVPSAAEARAFIERSQFVWHQRFELVPGVETPGGDDVSFLLDAGGLPADLRGKSVLDVSTLNGGAAFLLERRGADRVVAVDIYPPDWFGFADLHSFFRSRVEHVRGTVYEVGRMLKGETFDYVLLWGVLHHVRHPLLALDAVRSVLAPGGFVCVESAVCDDEVGPSKKLAVVRFYRGDELAADATNWFSPTVACLEDWCISSGLEPESTRVWGEGQGKRCMLLARRSADEPEFARISYEVVLRAEPAPDERSPDEVDEAHSSSAPVSVPARPWSEEYVDQHRRLVAEVLDDDDFVKAVRRGEPLPADYGVGFDERVVEFPWLFAQALGGRVLDAGSSLNHEHILDRVLARVDELHVVTLEPEPHAFPERRVSYVFADLRDLPYRDGYFDMVVCLSTLEHIGMDNTLYGVTAPPADDPDREMSRAVDELRRVTAPGGRILVTVPYGRREDHGRLRQFDRHDIDALLAALGRDHSVAVFSYGQDGWQVTDLDGAAESRYRDVLADPTPVPDRAAAARAVVCVSIAL